MRLYYDAAKSSWRVPIGDMLPRLGRTWGCDDETLRRVIKAHNTHGIKALEAGSRRLHYTQAAFSKQEAERLKEMLHKSPWANGKDISIWTLELVDELRFTVRLRRDLSMAAFETIACGIKIPIPTPRF